MPFGGFSKDYVERAGIAKNMKECVRSCCGSRDCDMAFMLANHCYRLRCGKDPKKCEPVPARGRHSGFPTQMVKLARRPIDEGGWSVTSWQRLKKSHDKAV
jgi:ribosomal protein S27AE